MTVDFRDNFWGERNAGFEILYRNCKQSHTTAKELVEYVRERSQIEENYSKLLAKLASSRLLGSGSSVGPLWAALRSSTEKAATVHAQLAHKLGDAVKDMQKYADEQHKKQKSVKDEEMATQEAVNSLQQCSLMVAKTKEIFETKKSDMSDPKRRKAYEDYKVQVEKHEQARVNFVQKMSESCARFQVLEENHLSAVKCFIDGYVRTLIDCYAMGAQLCQELQCNVDSLSIDVLLDLFVRERGTGKEKPETHVVIPETPPLSASSMHHNNMNQSNTQLHQSSEDVFKANHVPLSQSSVSHQHSQSSLYEFLGRNLTLRGRNKSTSKSESSPEVGGHGGALTSGPSASVLNALSGLGLQHHVTTTTATTTIPAVDEDGFSVPPPRPSESDAPRKLGEDSSSDDSSDSEPEMAKRIVVKIKPISEVQATLNSNRNTPTPILPQPSRLVSPPARTIPNQVLSPESNGNRTPPSILSELPKTMIPRPPSRRSVDRSSPSPLMTRAESIASMGSCSTGILSRGPSPLTLGLGDIIPIAVAFQEVVHASFRGVEESQCKVLIYGEMKMSFPAGILNALLSHPCPPPLNFSIDKLSTEKVSPNSLLLTRVAEATSETQSTYNMNMTELVSQLRKLHEMHPTQSYFNVDLLKYSLEAGQGAKDAPVHLVTYWNCDSNRSDLKVDYLYNTTQRWPHKACNAIITVTLPSHAQVANVHSKPPCSWNSGSKKAIWKIVNIKAGSILARFVHDAPLREEVTGEVAAQFAIEDAAFSNVAFNLAPNCGYRVSLVKKRIISGKYTAEM